ncbi:hypothetical protein NDU88_003359 [Pleurodeles waltl]|uniref:Uncharacterized protein n=1 Tax=Pleurodeles waltl TaxID=8319 RepID=A0AAV7V1I9_PLEWA|nr:hypothetical protein NDU88_003359 [Pleurodeles waltl]
MKKKNIEVNNKLRFSALGGLCTTRGKGKGVRCGTHKGVLYGTNEIQARPYDDLGDQEEDKDDYDEFILDNYDDDDAWDMDDDRNENDRKEKEILKDPQRMDVFSPDLIRHPISTDWWPMAHVGEFI